MQFNSLINFYLKLVFEIEIINEAICTSLRVHDAI